MCVYAPAGGFVSACYGNGVDVTICFRCWICNRNLHLIKVAWLPSPAA